MTYSMEWKREPVICMLDPSNVVDQIITPMLKEFEGKAISLIDDPDEEEASLGLKRRNRYLFNVAIRKLLIRQSNLREKKRAYKPFYYDYFSIIRLVWASHRQVAMADPDPHRKKQIHEHCFR
jgi:hypothetical protein